MCEWRTIQVGPCFKMINWAWLKVEAMSGCAWWFTVMKGDGREKYVIRDDNVLFTVISWGQWLCFLFLLNKSQPLNLILPHVLHSRS